MSTVVIVSGALANKYRNGGGTWERMSWVIGLQQLGCDVWFVEQISPQACVNAVGAQTGFAESVNLAWFRSVTQWFGIENRAVLVLGEGDQCAGLSWPQLREIAGSANLLVNLSGHLTLSPLLERIRCKAYVDLDPGFTQFWHVDPNILFHVGGHDFYFTIGENIGRFDCTIPTGGIPWRPIRQPIVLEQWPVLHSGSPSRFTTVASWRGSFGPVQAQGRTYGLKVHEFRKFIEFPRSAPAVCEIALDIHPPDKNDRSALEHHGWQLVNPQEVAGDPAAFRRYVQESSAEFSVAQGIYVETNSGWFSDRSLRYLSSGKPVLVQDTGLRYNYPVGDGVVVFRTLSEAAAGVKRILQDYQAHCRAARALAEDYFDSRRVLSKLLDETGISP